MATGPSNSELAVILVDARKGVLTQTRRHAYIVSLLGIRHVVLAVNKIDLVSFSEQRFLEIAAEFRAFALKLGFEFLVAIPVSARFGDNVIGKSARTPWYGGPALLEHLEAVDVETEVAEKPFRMPVQWVNRPNLDFRGFAGTIASGRILRGDEIVIANSGRASRVARIVSADGDLEDATAGQAVTVLLEDDVDVSRGDVFAAPGSRPEVADQFAAHVLGMADDELLPHRQYLIRTGKKTVPAQLTQLKQKVDVNTIQHLAP